MQDMQWEQPLLRIEAKRRERGNRFATKPKPQIARKRKRNDNNKKPLKTFLIKAPALDQPKFTWPYQGPASDSAWEEGRWEKWRWGSWG